MDEKSGVINDYDIEVTFSQEVYTSDDMDSNDSFKKMKGKIMKKIITIISLILFCLLFFFIHTSKQCNYERMLGKHINYFARVLESYDTHGGFHGDGESYIVFQFTDKQFNKFLLNVSNDDSWFKMPLSGDVKKISNYFSDGEKQRRYEIPLEISKGFYFIKDFQHSQKPLWNRNSVNFVIAILDSSQKRLYICRVDS